MMKDGTLRFLQENSFTIKTYEDQGLTFYHKEITDSKSIKKLIEHHYSIDPDEEVNTDGIGFVMEIEPSGKSPQWTFTGGAEMFEILNSEVEFVSYVKEINEILR
jgi:hypothetical protein